MKRKHKKKPDNQVKIAKERIKGLFDLAKTIKNQELANRYIEIARKIAMKFKIKISEYKRNFCKHCYALLIPGKNSRVRLYRKKLIYTCFECKKYTRYIFK